MEEKVYRTNLLRQILHVGSIAYVGIRKGGGWGSGQYRIADHGSIRFHEILTRLNTPHHGKWHLMKLSHVSLDMPLLRFLLKNETYGRHTMIERYGPYGKDFVSNMTASSRLITLNRISKGVSRQK